MVLKALRADCALLYIDALKRTLRTAENMEACWQVVDELHMDLQRRRKELLRYLTDRCDDEAGLIDLMLVVETTAYNIEALTLQELQAQEEMPQRQNMAKELEELIVGMSNLTLESEFLE